MDKSQLIATITGNKQVRDLVMKAAGAFMRGESPSQFMKNIAMSNPVFQGYNFDDIDATAAQICQANNANMESMKADITDLAKSYIK